VSDLDWLVGHFRTATGLDAVVWSRSAAGVPVTAIAGRTDLAAPPVVDLLTPGGPPAEVHLDDGVLYVSAVPAPRPTWVGVGPRRLPEDGAAALVGLLAAIVGQYVRAQREVEHAAVELAERYEEINLLYATSEIFGRTVTLEEAAARILEEIADTVGARRGALLVHDRATNSLQVVTSIGLGPSAAAPIAVGDAHSISARVFREQRGVILEPGPDAREAEFYRHGSLLSVPILWTNPGHPSLPLGVLNLSARRSGEPFSAGDEKLVSAIGTQIGTAIQINRLVRASISQQRLQHEMQMAHDLQMKLLPRTSHFLPEARVAAKVLPAESVGGDFYHLFRLGEGKTGVMIGDVSSHGYRAALIMALLMSAASIHAQTTADPAEMLTALLATLRDELETTEMFVSLFYGIIDPARSRLRFANAGHPHAFVVGADGCVERLEASVPPLGMGTQMPVTSERPWAPNADVLLLFTDGVSDARNARDRRLGEEAVITLVQERRSESPHALLDRVLQLLQQHMGDVPLRDDLTLVIARS
jgi:sigma-B regulation protein RsbU (phosphoserine phosphatase)